MVQIEFEQEVLSYLGLPSIPKKEYDNEKKPYFDKGVAVIEIGDGRLAYAVCAFKEGQKEPSITKVFSIEPFRKIHSIFIVPNYMSSIDDVEAMDLDEQSKKKAIEVLEEAEKKENNGIESNVPSIDELSEWIFPEIENREQANAWLRNYNKTNKLRNSIPKTDENMKLRLYSIYIGAPKQRKQKK